jgi:hypothetical protein
VIVSSGAPEPQNEEPEAEKIPE